MEIAGIKNRVKEFFFQGRKDAAEASKRRGEGIATVTANQDGGWLAKARDESDAYIASVPAGFEFIGEDVRLRCLSKGVGSPGHPNAWGAVIGGSLRRALKEKTIEIAGVSRAGTASSHRRNNVRYRKLG